MPPPALPTTLPAACVLLREASPPPIVLPGGATLTAITDVAGGDPGAIIDGLMLAASPALASLKPFFDVLGAIMAIKGVMDVVPKLIGPPPEPQAFFDALAELAKKIPPLAKLLPQASVPLAAKSILDTVIAGLRGLRVKLGAMLAAQERALLAATRAGTLPPGPARDALLQIADCAAGNLATQLANENTAMESLNQLIGLLNTLIQLVPGLPCIPTLGGTASISEDALAALDAVIAILELLEIPAPNFSLPGLPPPGEAPC